MGSLQRNVADFLARRFGSSIQDERTGKVLGKALLVPWGGRVWLMGLHRPYVRAVFVKESRVRYARHWMGFSTHAPVDFPRLRAGSVEGMRPRILKVVLVHQDAETCKRILGRWTEMGYDCSEILLAHGGTRSDFEKLGHQAVFVDDPRLRTVNHPGERQSYSGVMRAVAAWSESHRFSHVLFAEYDHLPVLAGWDLRMLDLLLSEDADVLFHHLQRVDGTNAPHYLEHLRSGNFEELWADWSVREDKAVVLNVIPTGSMWTMDAFLAVAEVREKWPVYLEMFMPSSAHHLGFRVREVRGQGEFVGIEPLDPAAIDLFRENGAWSVHPYKSF